MTAWINTRQCYSNAETRSVTFKHDQCATKKALATTKEEGMGFSVVCSILKFQPGSPY